VPPNSGIVPSSRKRRIEKFKPILTALITMPKRLVYLSSGMHYGAGSHLDDMLWEKRRWSGSHGPVVVSIPSACLYSGWPAVLLSMRPKFHWGVGSVLGQREVYCPAQRGPSPCPPHLVVRAPAQRQGHVGPVAKSVASDERG
jgi:hypothetical protein